ncbi:MAG: hypothetical protein ACE5R6_07335 [Candidatus Heimdallarchaeota archaeon]
MGEHSNEYKWMLVEDELIPEDFSEAIGRIRRIFTLRINIPYNLIVAAVITYFGALLVRFQYIGLIKIPLISRVTGDPGINFIAMSFFLLFLLLTFLTMFPTGIDLFHGPTRFFLVRIVSTSVLYIFVIGLLLLVWRVFSNTVTLLMLLIVFFWLMFQVSFLFRGCKSIAFRIHHRRGSKFLAFLAFLAAIVATGVVWLYSNNLIVDFWIHQRLPNVPSLLIQPFGSRITVTLASGAILLIFGVFSFFALIRRRLLEFLLFWFYLLYHYGLFAMNLARNIDPSRAFTVSPISGVEFELPVRFVDLILMVVTIIWVVHSLAYQAATTSIASRWYTINDFSMTHFFFSMAIVYIAGLLFFNATEFIIPGLPHASLKLIQAGIHGVMVAIGLLFVAGETIIWIVSLPFRVLYWLLKHPGVFLVLVFIGVFIIQFII